MLKQERQNAILSLLEDTEGGSMTTVKIAEELRVAPMTIRRDLGEMEHKKLLNRVYGGASLSAERTTKEKQTLQLVAKQQIGRALSGLVRPNTTVYLGAGTTVLTALDYLPKLNGIQYVTNSDIAFHYLVHKNLDVILTGGSYHKTTNEFFGAIASKTISEFFFDLAVVSTNGIWKNTATTSHMAEGEVQQAAIRRAKRVALVCDHTKFGYADRYRFLDLKEIDYIITDADASRKDIDELKQYTQVIQGRKED
jgi:DeoR/GlpR family transcriptional regulator of sugar metabolism